MGLLHLQAEDRWGEVEQEEEYEDTATTPQ
jgi:hypothetical protein